MPFYRISGLAVASDMNLPGAVPLAPPPDRIDVRIGCGSVPMQLENPQACGPFWQLTDRQFLLTLPDIGRFLACDGTELTMDAAPDTDPADGLPFLLGTGLGALLYQRGGVLLHASAVADGAGGAIAVCGMSGMGKSTLAAALCQRGKRFISDDVCAVALDAQGRPVLWPDGRSLKLFDQSIDQLGLAHARGTEIRTGSGKHYVEPPSGNDGKAAPLTAVYVLRNVKSCRNQNIERLAPLDAAQTLLNYNYRRRLALAMAGRSEQMTITSAILRHVPVFILPRSDSLDQLDQDVAALLAHWSGLTN